MLSVPALRNSCFTSAIIPIGVFLSARMLMVKTEASSSLSPASLLAAVAPRVSSVTTLSSNWMTVSPVLSCPM